MPGMVLCMPGSNVYPTKRGVMGEDRRSNRNRANGNRNRHGARDGYRSGTGRRPQPGSQRNARYSAQGGVPNAGRPKARMAVRTELAHAARGSGRLRRQVPETSSSPVRVALART